MSIRLSKPIRFDIGSMAYPRPEPAIVRRENKVTVDASVIEAGKFYTFEVGDSEAKTITRYVGCVPEIRDGEAVFDLEKANWREVVSYPLEGPNPFEPANVPDAVQNRRA